MFSTRRIKAINQADRLAHPGAQLTGRWEESKRFKTAAISKAGEGEWSRV